MYEQITTERSATTTSENALWDGVLSTGQVELKLRAGEPLFCEGDDADFVYEVLDGAVCSYSLLPDGRRQVIEFSFPGDIVGLGHQDIHHTTCDALGSVRVRSIPRSTLLNVAKQQPELGSKLLRCATDQLAGMQYHFVALGRKSAVEKVASFLLIIAKRFGGEDADKVTFTLPMIRADIADYLGLTLETVSRSLTKLKNAGIIDLPQSAIVQVHDMLELEELTEGTVQAI